MGKVPRDVDGDAAIWDAYNLLLLGPDIDRIRKLLVRYELAKLALEVPGDVVECGVFKGAGCLYWLKLLAILEPASLRRVIGFDTFSEFATDQREEERAAIRDFVASSDFAGVAAAEIVGLAEAAGLDERLELVVGDIGVTAAEYVDQNPGARVSLLHLDLDTYHGTQAALAALYPRVTRGGIIVLDEYAVPGWGETDAVDEFLADHPELQPQPVPYSAKPTAFFQKP